MMAGLFSKVTNLHDEGEGRRRAGSRESKKKEEEERTKSKMEKVVRKESRRHRLEVTKENGKRNAVGQITDRKKSTSQKTVKWV